MPFNVFSLGSKLGNTEGFQAAFYGLIPQFATLLVTNLLPLFLFSLVLLPFRRQLVN